MLLLDGVFIVQIIRFHLNKSPKYMRGIVRHYNDVLRYVLFQDIFLVENQLPFFVIRELFFMIEITATKDVFKEAIFKILHRLLPEKGRPRIDLTSLSLKHIKHLLHFLYHCCFPPSTSETEALRNSGDNRNPLGLFIKPLQDFLSHPSTSETEARDNPGDNRNPLRFIKHLQDFFCHPSTSDPEKNDYNIIRCATELQESGIKFKLFKRASTMFHIRFENGTLHIPKITIDDCTETCLLNLFAFEQLFKDRNLWLVSHYMVFMDKLIDSPKDVEILCQEGIIRNMLGDDEAVKTMINGIGVLVNSGDFHYTEIFEKVNMHCSRRWNKWMANLKHKYFNSPWALISVLAAALLLLLTVLQAVISVLAYLKQIRTLN